MDAILLVGVSVGVGVGAGVGVDVGVLAKELMFGGVLTMLCWTPLDELCPGTWVSAGGTSC